MRTSRSWACTTWARRRWRQTAAQFGISTGDPAELRRNLPFASYGQGAVLVSPFKMARVAAAIAAGGKMPEGRWIADESNPRSDAPVDVLPAGPGAVSGRSDAPRGAGRDGAARDGGHASVHRRQDRHGAARRRHAARLVHGLRALRWRRRRAWRSRCWWSMAATAAAWRRRSRGK